MAAAGTIWPFLIDIFLDVEILTAQQQTQYFFSQKANRYETLHSSAAVARSLDIDLHTPAGTGTANILSAYCAARQIPAVRVRMRG
jgi:hypothetical protein